jgi:hypothetical protein
MDCAESFGEQADRSLRRVPGTVRDLPGFRMTDAQWGALGLPAKLAFCYWSSLENGAIALYPTSSGAVESRLSDRPWLDIVAGNSALREMTADVEGLLVHRAQTPGHPRPAYVVVPIDACYRLIGVIRAYWRGETGGDEFWPQIDAFMTRLRGH